MSILIALKESMKKDVFYSSLKKEKISDKEYEKHNENY